MIAHHRQAVAGLEPDIAQMNAAAERAAADQQRHPEQDDQPPHSQRSRAASIDSRTRAGAVPPKLVLDATERATLSTS